MNRNLFKKMDAAATKIPILRKSYSLQKKVEVINLYLDHCGQNASLTSQKTGIDCSMISRWVKEKEKYQGHPRHARKICVESKSHYPELEADLHNWILSRRKAGRSVTFKILSDEALLLAKTYDLPKYKNFKCSLGWCQRFFERVKSSLNDSTAVKATETDTPGVKKFVPNFKKHPEFHYANKNIYSNAKPADDNAKDKSADTSVTSVEMNETNLAQALEFSLPAELSEAVVIEEKSMISIKIRAENERDFVELDIDRNMEFDDFKAVCMWELDNNNMDVPVLKIRKLPNVLIRNTRDVKRLVDDQEIEFIFK